MREASCIVCGKGAHGQETRVRSGRSLELFHCTSCDFDFFDFDPTANLAANKLDETRLKAAGLEIPTIERDFQNGIKQSIPHIQEYLDDSDVGRNVLEIGCSWGYFLKLAQDQGARSYGLEVNGIRAEYVKNTLNIPCEVDLASLAQSGTKFKKIFLFYVLEYLPDPVPYFKTLLSMLEDDGCIIGITPNVRDVLKDIWKNEGFNRFFYDENAIAYYSPKSMNKLFQSVDAKDFNLSTRQGYSFINHVSWHLTQAPRTTGIVGGDAFVPLILETLREDKEYGLGPKLASLMTKFDEEYKTVIQDSEFGNQIRFVLFK
jgi:2-polyprenyl-3-methyl-5-hydroxy-6-metoxy-1,4-benzoquinol methylase